MEDLDQGCDRRVEGDINIETYGNCLLNLGRVGECSKRLLRMHEVSLTKETMTIFGTSRKKNKMSETVWPVGHEKTTIMVAYIGFRPSWSLNVELL